MKSEVEVGKRYGQLLVIGKDNNTGRWICQCDCGSILCSYEKTIQQRKYQACGKCRAKIERKTMKFCSLPHLDMPEMYRRQALIDKFEMPWKNSRRWGGDSLCWYCAKACGGMGGCSWVREFRPVSGWDAKPHTICHDINSSGVKSIKRLQSYKVKKCPEFVRG